MATVRSTWKKAEGRVAELFGCRRSILSGSGGLWNGSGEDRGIRRE